MIRSIVLALLLAVASAASGDPQADGRAHADAFGRAMNAGDVKAALALYADDARVIFPGQGEEARGKVEIEKLLTTTHSCPLYSVPLPFRAAASRVGARAVSRSR